MTDTARILQVIETTLLRRGTGAPRNPIRIITQYWSLDGQLLAEVDPFLLLRKEVVGKQKPNLEVIEGGKEKKPEAETPEGPDDSGQIS